MLVEKFTTIVTVVTIEKEVAMLDVFQANGVKYLPARKVRVF